MFTVCPSLQCAGLGIQLALSLPSRTSPGSRAARLRWSPTGQRVGFLLSCKCMWRGNEGIFLLIDSDLGWSGVVGVLDDSWLSSLHLPIHHVSAMALLETLSLWSWSCKSRHCACHRSLGSSPAWDLPAEPLCPAEPLVCAVLSPGHHPSWCRASPCSRDPHGKQHKLEQEDRDKRKSLPEITPLLSSTINHQKWKHFTGGKATTNL